VTIHEHDWKLADDWDWGPGSTTYQCFVCRGLRIERSDTIATGEGDSDTLAAIASRPRATRAAEAETALPSSAAPVARSVPRACVVPKPNGRATTF
jgi:hypothetical protein